MKHLSGTVEELKRGKWRLIANLPPTMQDGKPHYPRKYKPVDAAGSKDAKAQLGKWLRTLEQSRCTDPATLTFAGMAEQWLAAETAETADPIQPATIDFYRSNLERHIVPTLGNRIASELLPADLSALYSERQSALSKSSLKHLKATISAAYSWAIEAGLQGSNPALTTRRRRNRARRREADAPTYSTWNHAQIAGAERLARGRLVHLPLMLGGWCGLRRGEIIGLRWDDVDTDAGTVSVNRSIEQVGSTLHVAPPKSDAGYRTIPMPDALCDALKARRELFVGLRLRHGTAWNPEGYVVATGKGTPVKPRNLSSAWSDFCRSKELPKIRLHDLRHSYATDLILVQRVDPLIVSVLLGHADPAITLRLYTHPDDKMQRRAGMRQNRRVAAAVAKAEQDSRRVRDGSEGLRLVAG